MKSLYSIVDHRAPRYIIRTEPHLQVIVRFFAVVGFVFALLGLGLGALLGGSLTCAALFAVAACGLVRWLSLWNRFVVRLRENTDLADYRIKEALLQMQAAYAGHPDLQPLMEPVMAAAYGFARQMNVKAVDERRRAIVELVASVSVVDPEVDDADLDELRSILAIRRQMRSEGLL